MTADGGVPVPGEQVLGHGTLLQVQLAVTVEDVQMDYRMKGLFASVAPLAGALAHDYAVGVHYREHLRRPGVRRHMTTAQDRRGCADRIDQLNHI